MKRGRPKKQTIDEKASEKTEKVDVPAPEQETIEDDQSMLPKKPLFRVDEVATYFSI